MRRLVIGSTALTHHIGGTRRPKDLDVFSPDPAPNEEAFWHPDFAAWIGEGADRIATLNELYTIKVSHSYWELRNRTWDKHMADIVSLKRAGAIVDDGLHALLYRVWEETHGRKQVDLDQDATDFFSDAVTRKYEHDSIHASVAYGDEPLYVRYLVPGETVRMDMTAVKAAPFPDQVRLFREEIYATALERWMIPKEYRWSPRRAYADALRKTITSLTKGWSARFIVENYEVFRTPDVDYVQHHKENSHKLMYLEDPNC